MQQTSEINQLERRVEFVVPMADVERGIQARLINLKKTAKMAGFRAGRVPLDLVARQYGPSVRSDVLSEQVQKALSAAISEKNLRMAGQPMLEARDDSEPGVLGFTAVVEVYPEFDIADIGDVTLERPTLTVTEGHVDKTIETLRKQRMQYRVVDRPAELGDKVTLDFVGTENGIEFPGGTGNGVDLTLGSNAVVPEFEQAVLGMRAGEEKVADVRFPDDYSVAERAGKLVQFRITCRQVSAGELPMVDADFARQLGIEDGNLDRLRAEVTANLEREVRKRLDARLKERVMDVLVEAHRFDLPRGVVQQEMNRLADAARREMASIGLGEQNLPVEPEWFRDRAERRVRLGLVMGEVIARHELMAKPEQVRALIGEFAESYEDPEEVIRWHYRDNEKLAQVSALVAENNVVQWVVQRARCVDTPIDFEELMGTRR